MQKHLLEHFNSIGHNGFLNDVSVTLIVKNYGKNPIKRGYYWQHTLKKLTSHGVNVENNF